MKTLIPRMYARKFRIPCICENNVAKTLIKRVVCMLHTFCGWIYAQRLPSEIVLLGSNIFLREEILIYKKKKG